jgi:LmbE family N-acetylglucosaminyl deacetylase
MHALGLSESEVFDGASWPEPMPEEYGLRVTRSTGSSSAFSVSRYAANFDRLKTELRTRLVGRKNVFTHNPWGEYGHEEHVQVFRAVEALQGEFGFRLWCSNYYSNKSYGLMVGSMAQVEGVHRSFRTRVDLAASLKELYTRTGCWTWYPDYRWPDHEAFIAWSGEARAQPKEGGVVPMNAVRVRFRKRRKISSRWSPGQVWRRARTRLTGSWSRTPSIETPGRVA